MAQKALSGLVLPSFSDSFQHDSLCSNRNALLTGPFAGQANPPLQDPEWPKVHGQVPPTAEAWLKPHLLRGLP